MRSAVGPGGLTGACPPIESWLHRGAVITLPPAEDTKTVHHKRRSGDSEARGTRQARPDLRAADHITPSVPGATFFCCKPARLCRHADTGVTCGVGVSGAACDPPGRPFQHLPGSVRNCMPAVRALSMSVDDALEGVLRCTRTIGIRRIRWRQPLNRRLAKPGQAVTPTRVRRGRRPELSGVPRYTGT
jgi:hypothetical protein